PRDPGDQARLATPRLAHERDDLAVASHRRVEVASQDLQVRLSPHEPGRSAPEVRARTLPLCQAVDSSRPVDPVELDEIEAPLEIWMGGLTYMDRVRLGGNKQCLQNRPRAEFCVEIDFDSAGAGSHERVRDVDAELAPLPPTLAARPLACLMDRHRGKCGPPRGILDRVVTERCHQPGGTALLDAPAERLHLLRD